MELYIMRHGETNWNRDGIIQGRSHNMLSEKGKKQVLDQAIKYKNIDIDIIISSPLRRTIQTANIFNQFHNAPIIKDERLTEIDQGIFTGRKKKSMSDDENQLKKSRSPVAGMESSDSIMSRVRDFLNDLTAHYNDKRVMVVTHRGIAKVVYSLVLNENATADEINKLDLFDNAEIIKLDIVK